MEYISKIEYAYDSLTNQSEKLVERYIQSHIGNVDSTDADFSLDVKSYLILLHAAIEDYIEGISVFASNAAHEIFKDKGIITMPFLFVCATSKSFENRLKDASKELIDSPKNFLLSELGNIHDITVKKAINNNGINVRYLNSLLQHCGINFDTKANEFISWKKLADYRGDYAHAVFFHHGSKPKTNKILSPEDAMDLGSDCISFCLNIKQEALAALAWTIEKK